MNSYLEGKYQVVCFLRIDTEDDDDMELSLREAEQYLDQLKFLLPGNIYRIERIDEAE